MGITIPRQYGGPGGSVLDVLLVVEEVARACGITARIIVEGSLGVVGRSPPTAPRRRSAAISRGCWKTARNPPSPSPSRRQAPPPPIS